MHFSEILLFASLSDAYKERGPFRSPGKARVYNKPALGLGAFPIKFFTESKKGVACRRRLLFPHVSTSLLRICILKYLLGPGPCFCSKPAAGCRGNWCRCDLQDDHSKMLFYRYMRHKSPEFRRINAFRLDALKSSTQMHSSTHISKSSKMKQDRGMPKICLFQTITFYPTLSIPHSTRLRTSIGFC